MFQPIDLYRVIIHNSEELPYRTGHHYFFERQDVATIDVGTKLTIIDKALESWTPEQRNCLMEDEKKLKFFKIYSKVNCEHECLSQASLDICGCIPFYMIREFNLIFHEHFHFENALQEAPVTEFVESRTDSAIRWLK